MVEISMDWNEIKRHLKNEMPLHVMADLNGIDEKTMTKIIRKLEEENGEKVLPPAKRGRPKTNNPGRSTQYRRKKEQAQEERPPMTLNPEFWEKLAGRKEEADAAMVDLIVDQIFSLEEQIEQIERQAAPLRYQLDKWKKIKEALENDTL